MSLHTTSTIHCDDCGEPASSTIGMRSPSDARSEAKMLGFVRRRLTDGWADLCGTCDGERSGDTSAAKKRAQKRG